MFMLIQTRVYHPNVYANGSICLDVLNTRWSPSYDVATLLVIIATIKIIRIIIHITTMKVNN